MSRARRASWAVLLAACAVVLLVAIGPRLVTGSTTATVGPPWSDSGALGTDELGRDVLARLLAGGTGLLPAIPLGLATTALATPLALVAGQSRRAAALLAGSTGILLAVPGAVVVLAAAALLPSWAAVALVMGLLGVPLSARQLHAATRASADSGYAEAARLRGEGPWLIAVREMLPAALPALVADAGVRCLAAMHLLVGVHVLGLGPQAPAADWALMIRGGLPGVTLQPAAVLAPAAAIAVLSTAVLLGLDALAEILRPPVAHAAGPGRHRESAAGADGTDDAAVELHDLVVRRAGRWVLAVPALRLAPGEVLGVVGPSGAGKTTLLQVLAGTIPSGAESSGVVRVLGAPVTAARSRRRRREQLGIVEQDPLATIDARLSVARTIADGRRRGRRAVIDGALLEDAGLPAALLHRRARLSGGQAARVALLRALVHRPRLLLLDEPTAGPDEASRERVIDLIRRRPAGTTVVAVSHDQRFLAAICDRILEISADGDGTAHPPDVTPADAATRAVVPERGAGAPRERVLLRLGAVDVTAPDGTPLLHDIHLEIGPGELVALRGPSGLGKSTLLRQLCGLLPVPAGTVELAGRADLVAQDADLALNPFWTGRRQVLRAVPGQEPDAAMRAATVLEELGVHEAARRRPGECSGGQRQRIALARALVAQPLVLLVDEPTAGLDHEATRTVIGCLRAAASSGRAVLVATHDETVAAACDRTVDLEAHAAPRVD